MTDATYPLELLRAELKSAMAEQLVQLMDRFASKQELDSFRRDFAEHQRDDEKHFAEINDKLDTLLTEKDRRDGATSERKRLFDRRWVLVSALFGSTAATLTAVATVVWLHFG